MAYEFNCPNRDIHKQFNTIEEFQAYFTSTSAETEPTLSSVISFLDNSVVTSETFINQYQNRGG